MRRIVHLLGALTPAQAAQRKYRRSAKGRAAQARYFANRVARDPAFQERGRARARAASNTTGRRVYKRVWIRTKRRASK